MGRKKHISVPLNDDERREGLAHLASWRTVIALYDVAATWPEDEVRHAKRLTDGGLACVLRAMGGRGKPVAMTHLVKTGPLFALEMLVESVERLIVGAYDSNEDREADIQTVVELSIDAPLTADRIRERLHELASSGVGRNQSATAIACRFLEEVTPHSARHIDDQVRLIRRGE